MAQVSGSDSIIAKKYNVEHQINGYNANGQLNFGGNKFPQWLNWSNITAGINGFVENRASSAAGIQVFDPDYLAMKEIFRMGRFIIKIMKYPPFFPPIACEMARWLFEDQVRGVDAIPENSISTVSIEIGATQRTVDYPGMYKESGKDITLKTPEWKGRPLGKFMEWYLGALSDRETGIGTLYGRDMNYVKPNYGITFLYIILGPTARPEDIEYSCLYHECFPTKEVAAYMSSNTLGDVGNVGDQDVTFSGIFQTGLQVDSLAQIVTSQYGLYNETYQDMILPSYFYKGLLAMNQSELEQVRQVMSIANKDRLEITKDQGVNGYSGKAFNNKEVLEVMEEVRFRALGDVDSNPASAKNLYPWSKAIERSFMGVNDRGSASFTE